MTIVASYDWESDTFTHQGEAVPPVAVYLQAIHTEAASMQANCPDLATRITDAAQLVLSNAVTLGPTGGGTVRSRTDSTVFYEVNGTCPCKDAEYTTPYCAHRIAVTLLKRVTKQLNAPMIVLDLDPLAVQDVPVIETPSIPPEHMVEIQGRLFVKFAGLLALAHARGLVSLTADWTFNDASLSLAHAVAVFPFGTFAESGDASPDNVTKKVAPHFRRVALTRAKARVLRDALNVDMVSLEELSEVA